MTILVRTSIYIVYIWADWACELHMFSILKNLNSFIH